MEAMKSTLKVLRQELGAKDAELAIIKSEADAFRRQLVPGAQSTLNADTEVPPSTPNSSSWSPELSLR